MRTLIFHFLRPNRASSAPGFCLCFLLLLASACSDDGAGEGASGDAGTGTDAGLGDAGDGGNNAPLETVAIETGSLSLRVQVDPFSFELRNASGVTILSTLATPSGDPGDPIQSAYGPLAVTWNEPEYAERTVWGWDTYIGENDPWTALEETLEASVSEGVITLRLGSSEAGGPRATASLRVEENRLTVDIAVDEAFASRYNRIGQTFLLGSEEHILGLGARFASIDHRGRSYTNWVEEGGLGAAEHVEPGPDNPRPNGESMTSFPVPFFLSTAGYGFWANTTFRSVFHLGSEMPDLWRVEVAEPRLRYTVYVNRDPMETLEDFTAATGRPPLPPVWAFGPRRRIDVDAEVYGMPEWRALREFGIATTAIEDGVQFLPFGAHIGREEELAQRASDLHRWGFRAMGALSPHLAADTPAVADDFRAAANSGYLVLNGEGEPYLISLLDADGIEADTTEVAILDFTSRGAEDWYQNLVESALSLGYDGWMLEHGEYVPDDAVFSDGSTGFEMHNLYPVLAQQALLEVLQESDTDLHYYARAGYTGSSGFVPMVWSGTVNSSFSQADGLPAVVRAGLNLGLSGGPFFGSDIGGFHAIDNPPPDKELYLRWTAFAALSPEMRDENTGAGAQTRDYERWTIWSDPETLSLYGEYARLHTRLAPYLHALALEASETGAPLMRHPWLLFPSDMTTIGLDDEYFLGSALLVAPVLERGVDVREVYFPRGWYYSWDGEQLIEGGQAVNVDIPIDRVPMFIADGGIVPMLDSSIDTLTDATRQEVVDPAAVAGVLDVRAVRSPGTSTFALVDGTTLRLSVTGGVEPPFLVGGAELVEVTDLADLVICDGCFLLSSEDPKVLLLTTPMGENLEVRGSGIELSTTNPPGRPRRLRWEIVLPEVNGQIPEE